MGIIILLGFLLICILISIAVAFLGEDDTRLGGIGAGGFFLIIFFIVLIVASQASVGVGTVGVPVSFGHTGADLQPGFHFKAPWKTVVDVNVRTQQLNLNGDSVHSSDNVTSNVNVSVLYSVNAQAANALYRNVGTDYLDQVVIPSVRSALQDNSKNYTAVALTAADRDDFSAGVLSELKHELGPRGITVQQVLVREVDLPGSVASAVNAKVAAQQQAQAQQYVLQQTTTQVKIAQQQADANKILSSSLTPEIICNNWVNAVAKGSITGPFYTTPCSTGSNSQPTVLVPGQS